ncbi:MAG: phospholipase D family protein [Solibacillus sp.]|uniref:phospholipase D family protein n=1 Tax=Solibacillus sp. TaxID=1909654 RepID=UPI00331541D8
MIISSQLYSKVIEKNALYNKRLKVLSGYASAGFLERVVTQFPYLEVELYIGMAKQGITFKDHLKFTDLCRNNPLIKVYYQIYEPNNHMKIYQFENSTETLKFIGSANFSENGFIKQREILVGVLDNFQYIFDEQLEVSLSCIDENILDYIPLTLEEEIEKSESEKGDIRHNSITTYKIGNNPPSDFIKNKSFLKTKIDPTMYEKFDVLIVQPAENNPRWASSTINARFINRESYIRQNNTWNFQNVFPSDKEFKIYFESKCITCYLNGAFGAYLYFKDFDLYEYLYTKLSLEEERAISFEDLAINSIERLYFIRINETTYIMSFEKN